MIKGRNIWYGFLLLVAVAVATIAILYSFDLGPTSKISEKIISEAKVEKKIITPEDVDREGKRSWC